MTKAKVETVYEKVPVFTFNHRTSQGDVLFEKNLNLPEEIPILDEGEPVGFANSFTKDGVHVYCDMHIYKKPKLFVTMAFDSTLVDTTKNSDNENRNSLMRLDEFNHVILSNHSLDEEYSTKLK